MTDRRCPQGHTVTGDAEFCSVCGFEVVPDDEGSAVRGETDLQRAIRLSPEAVATAPPNPGAPGVALFAYLTAGLAGLAGVIAFFMFTSIPRLHGVDRAENVGMLVIAAVTLVAVVGLVALGEALDLLSELVERGREAPALDAPTRASDAAGARDHPSA